MKDGLIAVLRFFLFLLILPVIIASALAFETQILGAPAHKEQWLLWGALVYILLYIFLYNFKDVYTFGHTIVSNLCRFFEPLVSVGGLIIPIFTVLIICIGLILNVLGLMPRYEGAVLFAIAFTFTMHIVLTANQMYEADKSPIKAQYLIGFGVVLVVQIFLISLLLRAAIPEYSFLGYFKSLTAQTASYYKYIYHLLFVSP